MRASRKCALAQLLVEQEIFTSVDEARRWIMAGQVLVNEQRIDKPGMLVPRDAVLRVRGRRRYASRGGHKLEAALEHYHIDIKGRVALDSGASTGGFTDCLLQHGASLVYAVEVGYGQLLGRLRTHPGVRNMERTNISDLHRDELVPLPSLITLDLSYLSLTKALPIAAALLERRGAVLALFKPLFEVEDAEARRTGEVHDVSLIVAALQRVLACGEEAGLQPRGVVKLALQPRHGVAEFIVYFVEGEEREPWLYDENSIKEIVSGEGIGSSVEA